MPATSQLKASSGRNWEPGKPSVCEECNTWDSIVLNNFSGRSVESSVGLPGEGSLNQLESGSDELEFHIRKRGATGQGGHSWGGGSCHGRSQFEHFPFTL